MSESTGMQIAEGLLILSILVLVSVVIVRVTIG